MSADLSFHHKPVGDFLDSSPVPSTPEGWAQLALGEAELREFEEKGYLANVQILSSEQVEALLAELEQIRTGEHPGHHHFHEFHSNESPDPSLVLMHCLGAWRIMPGFHDVVYHPRVARICSQLLGDRSVRLWHDQLFCKPAHHGACVAWHQDFSYWTRTGPMAHLTVHIALDDQTEENGCLQYVPRSHKWPLLPITSRHFDDMDSIRSALEPEHLAQFKPQAILLKKGQAAIHHPLLVHGSYANQSDQPRRATVVNVFADGTASLSEEPLLRDVPVIPPGQPLTGQFFPVLFDASVLTADQ